MKLILNRKQILHITSSDGKCTKYLRMDLILRKIGLSPVDSLRITEGTEEGEHYYKHIINELREYTKVWFVTIQETKSEINELIKELKSRPEQEIKSKENKEKSKMNLSVSELALGVKFLEIVKIIDAQQKTELYRKITENFQTKGSENIGYKSFKNKFENPDDNAVKFWQDKFAEIQKYIQENL